MSKHNFYDLLMALMQFGAPVKHPAAFKHLLRALDHIITLLLTIPKLSLYFLQVFWLGSKIKFTERTIWSDHPVIPYIFKSCRKISILCTYKRVIGFKITQITYILELPHIFILVNKVIFGKKVKNYQKNIHLLLKLVYPLPFYQMPPSSSL
jgi:hypothetical protein